ncbi:MAG: hypothetical protein NVS3B21_33010 [Acidimicrobiales bacterium]
MARATGTSESNVAAYERGDKEPAPPTAERLRLAIAAGADSSIHKNRLLTVPATAAALRRGLKAGWTRAELLRLVRECLSNTEWLATGADRAAFFSAPSTCGDRRWDALLAGAIEDHFVSAGAQAPRWTRGHALRQFWCVCSPAFESYALANSPPSMKLRGVMMDPADLFSV